MRTRPDARLRIYYQTNDENDDDAPRRCKGFLCPPREKEEKTLFVVTRRVKKERERDRDDVDDVLPSERRE